MTQHRAYVVSTPFFKVSSNTQGQEFCISLYLRSNILQITNLFELTSFFKMQMTPREAIMFFN